MPADVRRIIAMLVRVCDFLRTHLSTDASFNALASRFEAQVELLPAVALKEQDGRVVERNANARRADLRRDLQQRLRHLEVIGQLAAATKPELARLFLAPRIHAPHAVLITVARQMLSDAAREKDLLLQSGIGDTVLDDLAKLVDAFDASTKAAADGRANHVGARAELRKRVDECALAVQGLDTLIRIQFKNDPHALAGWTSARNVEGPFRKPDDSTDESKAA